MKAARSIWKASMRRKGLIGFWLLFLLALVILVIVKLYMLFESYSK